MGGIISKVKEIDNIRFEKMKLGKIYQGCDVIRISDKSYIVKLPNGKFHNIGYSSNLNENIAILGYGIQSTNKLVLKSLVKMGAISEQQVEDHLKAVEIRYKNNELKYARLNIKRYIEDHGIDEVQSMIDEISKD